MNFKGPASQLKKLYLCSSLIMIVGIGCGSRGMEPATSGLINEAESHWRRKAISSYRIVVDVQMNRNTRRNEVTIKNGKIDQAIISYKDNFKWKRQQKLNETQALAFTIPGLFETVREELKAHVRTDIRVVLSPDGTYFQRIAFGPVLQNNRPIPSSEVYIFVRQLELVPST